MPYFAGRKRIEAVAINNEARMVDQTGIEKTTPVYQTPESLGMVLHSLRPKLSNKIAGVLLIIIFIAVGGLFVWAGYRDLVAEYQVKDRIPRVIMAVLVGVFFVGMAGLIVYYLRTSLSFSISICLHGFYANERGKPFVVGWQDIVLVQEVLKHTKVRVMRGVVGSVFKPTSTSRVYRVYRCDLVPYEISCEIVQNSELLIGPLKRESLERNIPWRNAVEHR